MVRKEFVEQLAARMGVTFSEADRWLRNFTGLIYHELQHDRTVNLHGFGIFSVSHRAARIGVNPRQPSQKITIPALNTPKFKAGDGFKQAVKLH